jgi:hypothetical protein
MKLKMKLLTPLVALNINPMVAAISGNYKVVEINTLFGTKNQL